MKKLSELEVKCGRLIVGRLPGLDLPEDYIADLKNGGMGGITLFRENCQSVDQLSNLVGGIYENSHHSPVVTADQEGGAVQRFNPAFASMPSHMAYAACPDRELAKEVMYESFSQMKMLGLNFILSPVLDVVSNCLNPIVSTRSFGSIPGIVERNAKELIELIEQAGLVSCGKHFPGHGATLEDSHVALAVSEVNSDRLWNVDLAPFKNCLDKLPAILTGHIWLKCVDDNPVPSSLSPRVTNSILRDYLKYDGLIVTDDMTMKGLTSSSRLDEACVKAVQAGNDLLLICGSLEESTLARQAIYKAVKDGEISEDIIDKSISRIDSLFGKRLEPGELPYKNDEQKKRLNESIIETKKKRFELGKSTACILRGELPKFIDSDWTVVVPDHPRYCLDLSKHLKHSCESVSGSLKTKIEEIRYSVNPDFEENKETSIKLKGKNCIFVTFRGIINEGQMQLGQMIADQCSGNKQIAVITDMPFDYDGLPDWPNVLASFDPCDEAINSLAYAIVENQITSKASSYFARLVEGVTVINRNKVIQ